MATYRAIKRLGARLGMGEAENAQMFIWKRIEASTTSVATVASLPQTC